MFPTKYPTLTKLWTLTEDDKMPEGEFSEPLDTNDELRPDDYHQTDDSLDLSDNGMMDNDHPAPNIALSAVEQAVLCLIADNQTRPYDVRDQINSVRNARYSVTRLISLGLIQVRQGFYEVTNEGVSFLNKSGLIMSSSDHTLTKSGTLAVDRYFRPN